MTVGVDVIGPGEESAAVDLVGEASRLLAEGDAAEALELLKRAAAADPDAPRLQFTIGLLAWRLGDLDQALAILRACHDRETMNGTVAEIVASLFAQAGNLAESLYYGKLATALEPARDFAALVPPMFPSFDAAFFAIRERPLFARAKTLIGSGKLPDGLDLARQHLALNPGDDEARLFHGEGLLRAGAAAHAVETLEPLAENAAAPARALSLYARALSDVGDQPAARRTHEAACTAAPDDPEIAAARVADLLWLGDAADRRRAAADWKGRFCPAHKPARALVNGKIVIGYLVSRLTDPRDVAAVAAVAQAHDRAAVTVLGYGIGAQSWEENARLSGVFDKWRDISGVDPATLARILRGDGLQIAIDCSGFFAPQQLLALGRLATASRFGWLGGVQALHEGVLAGYPLVRTWLQPIPRSAGDRPRFGADCGLRQLDERTVGLWSAILEGASEASLLLRATDMAPGRNIDRLIARFGRTLAARIDVVEAVEPEEFYREVDLALAPIRGASPRMAAEAIACGVPVVALEGRDAGEPYGALLRALGLGQSLVAADERDYLSIALGLAASAEARRQMTAAVAPVAAAGERSARRFAGTIEQKAADLLARGAP